VRIGRGLGGVLLGWALAFAALGAEPSSATPKKAPARKKPTVAELSRQLEEQRALVEEQQRLITEQQAKISEYEERATAQDAVIEEQRIRLAGMEHSLLEMTRRLEALEQQVPGLEEQGALDERLKRIEKETEKVPELAATAVSAGHFPGSIRIPGTDAAVKFGGRIRTAAVFTLGPLGSEDRFLTNSIPVTPSDAAAGKGKRTTFSANTSRFNFEMRTPTGVGQTRAFLEGDFFGATAPDEQRTAFRLRHAFAQFKGCLVGQTWSTFSDPAANHQDLDFEGINGENVIRQPQFRYTWQTRENFSIAAAAETPEVSLTGGQGVNLVPDLVGRAIWTFKEIGHLQTAVVLRQIRGESTIAPGDVKADWTMGATVSGVFPFHYFGLTDRFIFQLNAGRGVARYINDLNSLGGQDAVFHPTTGELHPLPAVGWYFDYEHQWKEWETTRVMKLRSSFIWSFVTVDNLDFQLDDAYHQTNRYSVNLVFSPIERIDVGIEYIYGTRENKNGARGSSDQFQIVGIFRF
jgi:hypothetical protein